MGYSWGAYGHQVIGRLKPGVTLEQARVDVYRIGEELQRENPVWRPAMPEYLDGVKVSDLRDRLVQDSQRLLYVLLGAVGLVLAMACANVANLLVVRGAARTREMSIRAAIGAGAGRLSRQLFLEHLLLAGTRRRGGPATRHRHGAPAGLVVAGDDAPTRGSPARWLGRRIHRAATAVTAPDIRHRAGASAGGHHWLAGDRQRAFGCRRRIAGSPPCW